MDGLGRFAGHWQVERDIRDHRAGIVGRFEGQAVFAPDGAGLVYDENGLLRLGDGPALRATRRYLWREGARGIEVLFADGRRFHEIGPEGTAAHLCAADLYRVAYDFARWPAWEALWRVSGPAKDYEMRTRYRPAR